MKLKYILFPLVALLLIALFFTPIVQLPYTIRSRAVVYPAREWILSRAGEGQLAYTLNDNFHNSVSHYAITEFQRGDHGEFVLNNEVFINDRVNRGDTIGVIHSSEEQRRYIQLQGELTNRKGLLSVYMAGERAQDVAIAYEMIQLAEKEYETQKKLTERAHTLFKQEVIPSQEYEIALNEYEVKKMALQIARSQYEAAGAGAKPEQLDLVRSEISSLESQIQQLAERIQAFTIVSPFSGVIIHERQQESTNPNFIRIADDSVYIVILPVEVHQLAYISVGQKVNLVPENRAMPVQATIAAIGNSVQLLNRRQNVFLTATIDNHLPHILPGMVIDAQVDTGSISLREFTSRLVKTIYAN